MLSLFMSALEVTVVSTAMPTAIGDLGGIHLYSWVFAIYMLTATVTGPIYGKLADLYGRKPVFLFGAVLFFVGSMACGYSQTMFQLIALRAVQGIGAGAVGPIALTILGDIFTLEERGRVQGLFSAVWGVSGLVGPMAGGLIVKFASWRWVFFINVPVGIAAITMIAIGLHERVEKREAKLDILGGIVLSAAIVSILLAAGGTIGVWLAAPSALLLLALFLFIERKAPEPILPLDLYSKPMIALAMLANALLGAVMLAQVTYIPFFVQAVLAGSPTEAGSAVTPMIVVWTVASVISGYFIPRIGFRIFIRLGFAVTAVGCAILAFGMGPAAGLGVPRIASSVTGLGLGFAATTLLLAVQTGVPWKQRGVATAGTIFARNIGGTLAVGLMGGILAGYFAASPNVSPDLASQMLGPEHGRGLPIDAIRSVSSILEAGLGTIFWITAGLGVASFIAALFFPSVPMPSDPALGPASPQLD
jgi:EmrB/QacA subfamily drug resistance transporter